MRAALKKSFIAIAFLSSIAAVPSTVVAGGIPVVDAAAIGKMIEQIQNMQQQYLMLEMQYKEAQRMTSKLEGVSGIGEAIRIEVIEVLFPELADYLEDLTLENMPSGAQDIFNERGYDKACATDAPTYNECMENYIYLATSQYAYEESARNTKKLSSNLTDLKNEISNAKTQKEISDLQARISAEAAQIQLAQLKADQLERSINAARENAINAQSVKLQDSFWGSLKK